MRKRVAQKITPEERAYRAMRQRCLNPRAPYYSAYGGRGISTLLDRIKKGTDLMRPTQNVGAKRIYADNWTFVGDARRKLMEQKSPPAPQERQFDPATPR
jgi:hypothetical protein